MQAARCIYVYVYAAVASASRHRMTAKATSRRGGLACAFRQQGTTRHLLNIRRVAPLPANEADVTSWTQVELTALRHAVLASGILSAHATFWRRVHSASHTATTLLTFSAVFFAIAKDELVLHLEPATSESGDASPPTTVEHEHARLWTILNAVIVACPLAASVLLIIMAILAPRRRSSAYRLAAALCESECFRFRCTVGPYGEQHTPRHSTLVARLQTIWDDTLRPAHAIRAPLSDLEAACGRRVFWRCDPRRCWQRDVHARIGAQWMQALVDSSAWAGNEYPPPRVPRTAAAEAEAAGSSGEGDVDGGLWGLTRPVADGGPSQAQLPSMVRVPPPKLHAPKRADSVERLGWLRPPGLRRRASSRSWRWRADPFGPLTSQRYQELRVWPALAERLSVGPAYLRRLRRLRHGILACTLASTSLACLSFTADDLQSTGVPPRLSALAGRATRFVPICLAMAAVCTSVIEAEALPQRARAADAAFEALKGVGRWFEGLAPSEVNWAEHREKLVELAEAAMREELVALMEAPADRKLSRPGRDARLREKLGRRRRT